MGPRMGPEPSSPREPRCLLFQNLWGNETLLWNQVAVVSTVSGSM